MTQFTTSIISEKQDTAAYLRVLALALRNYGAPEAIVTDGGGVFYSTRAMAIQDNRHSPQDVLRGILARTIPAPALARIFFATQFTRHLERSGYIRFRRWRFYVEAGLARQEVSVHIYTSTLKVEYQETDLALYTVAWHEDNKHITEVTNPRVIGTGYRSPQLTLWTLGPDEWLLFKKLPEYSPHRKRKRVDIIQLPLPDLDMNVASSS